MNNTNTTEASVGATVGILGAVINHLKLLGEIASPLAAQGASYGSLAQSQLLGVLHPDHQGRKQPATPA